MYMLPDMIEMGLEDGKDFTTGAHKEVCITCVIGRPGIDNLDQMIEMVKAINAVPVDRIQTVTIKDLQNEFNVPYLY